VRFFEMAIEVLGGIAMNAVMALIFTIVVGIVLSILLPFMMIPVAIFGGDATVVSVTTFMKNWGFQIIYGVAFIDLMLEDFLDTGFVHAAKKFWRWEEKEKKC